MIRRGVLLFLGLLLLLGAAPPAPAAGPKAAALRQKNGLIACTPPEGFLAANFVTAEMAPPFIFGTVRDFAASRGFPVTWLMEADAKTRFTSGENPGEREYFLYLEEDRPEKVIYYVFADQSAVAPDRWPEFRRFFFKSASEEDYAPVKAGLEQARQEGCGAGAELAFIEEDGSVKDVSLPAYLRQELRFAPLYDLRRHGRVAR